MNFHSHLSALALAALFLSACATPRPIDEVEQELLTLETLEISSPRIGVVQSVDSNEATVPYLDAVFAEVEQQWRHIVSNTPSLQAEPAGSVNLSFTFRESGEVANTEITYSSASDLAALVCKDALLSRAPFSPWTDQMREAYGESSTVTLRFHYP